MINYDIKCLITQIPLREAKVYILVIQLKYKSIFWACAQNKYY